MESDCQELDCLIQLIEYGDVQRIIDLHPNAKLTVENPEKVESQNGGKISAPVKQHGLKPANYLLLMLRLPHRNLSEQRPHQ